MVKKIFLFSIIFVVSLLIFTFPSYLQLSTKLIGDGYDNYQYSSLQFLFKQKISLGQNPLGHNTSYYYPHGFDLANSYDGLLPTLIGTFLQFITSPTISFNLSVYFVFLLNFIGGFIAAKLLTPKASHQFLSAVFFGFSAYTLNRAGSHLNLQLIAGIPVYFAALHSLFHHHSTKTLSILLGSTIFISVSSLQYLAFVFLLTVFYLCLSAAFNFKQTLESIKFVFLPKQLFLIALTISFVFMFFFPYFKMIFTNHQVFARKLQELTEYSTTVQDLFLPNKYATVWYSPLLHSTSVKSIELNSFPGFLTFTVFSVCLFAFSASPIFLSLAFLCLIFSFGPVFMLFYNLPVFSFITEPGRFMLFFYIFSYLSLFHILSNIKPKKAYLLLLLPVFFIADNIPTSLRLSPNLYSPELAKIQNYPGQGLLNIYVDPYNQKYNQEAIWHGKSITDGYIHWTGRDSNSTQFVFSPLLSRFICENDDKKGSTVLIDQKNENQELIQKLKQLDIRTIILHKTIPYYYSECDNTRHWTQIFLPKTQSVSDTFQKVSELHIEYPATDLVYQKLFFPTSGNFVLAGALLTPSQNESITIIQNNT